MISRFLKRELSDIFGGTWCYCCVLPDVLLFSHMISSLNWILCPEWTMCRFFMFLLYLRNERRNAMFTWALVSREEIDSAVVFTIISERDDILFCQPTGQHAPRSQCTMGSPKPHRIKQPSYIKPSTTERATMSSHYGVSCNMLHQI